MIEPSAPVRAAAAGLIAVGLLASCRPGAGGDAKFDTRAVTAACADLSPAEVRGRRLFRHGTTAAGRPIEGVLDGGDAVLRGREAACAMCHGLDGSGNEEGGVSAPSLKPERLFAATTARVAYTAATLASAVREGRTPAARRLSVMPRYRLDGADLDDLIAYLGCVGHDADAGVLPDAVKLGAVLPLSGPLAARGAAVRDVLTASLQEVNAASGVFRRRLDLVVADSAALGEEGAASRLAGEGVFAFVGNLRTEERSPAVRQGDDEIPIVAPIEVAAPASQGGEDSIFHLQPSLEVLAQVAIRHLASSPPRAAATTVLVIAPPGAEGESFVRGARIEAARRALPEPQPLWTTGSLESSAVLDRMRAPDVRALLFFGEAAELARCAAALAPRKGSRPFLYAPAWLIDRAPSALEREVVERVSWISPRALGTSTGAVRLEFSQFLERHPTSSPANMALQASAYAAARVLIEGLRRAGAYLTRAGLVAALEGLRDFDAGSGPVVSFGRNRRIGVMGASVFRLDPASRDVVPVSGWFGVVP